MIKINANANDYPIIGLMTNNINDMRGLELYSAILNNQTDFFLKDGYIKFELIQFINEIGKYHKKNIQLNQEYFYKFIFNTNNFKYSTSEIEFSFIEMPNYDSLPNNHFKKVMDRILKINNKLLSKYIIGESDSDDIEDVALNLFDKFNYYLTFSSVEFSNFFLQPFIGIGKYINQDGDQINEEVINDVYNNPYNVAYNIYDKPIYDTNKTKFFDISTIHIYNDIAKLVIEHFYNKNKKSNFIHNLENPNEEKLQLGLNIEYLEILIPVFDEEGYGINTKIFFNNEINFKIYNEEAFKAAFNPNPDILLFLLQKINFKKIKIDIGDIKINVLEGYTRWRNRQQIDKSLNKQKNLKQYLIHAIDYINRNVTILNDDIEDFINLEDLYILNLNLIESNKYKLNHVILKDDIPKEKKREMYHKQINELIQQGGNDNKINPDIKFINMISRYFPKLKKLRNKTHRLILLNQFNK